MRDATKPNDRRCRAVLANRAETSHRKVFRREPDDPRRGR